MCAHMVSKQNRPVGARVQVAPVFSAIVFLSVLGFPTARAAYSQDASGSNSTVTLPAGTKIMVRMVDSVDSDNSQPQQRFRGALDANLSAGGRAIAPKGTTVFGRLLVAESANGTTGGRLEFDLTDIE